MEKEDKDRKSKKRTEKVEKGNSSFPDAGRHLCT
jgi:hypothetical protein